MSTMSNPSFISVSSPTTVYSGPPPPYSYSPSNASSTSASHQLFHHQHPHQIPYASPASSRRTSGGDEKEPLPLSQPAGVPGGVGGGGGGVAGGGGGGGGSQSLPPIHEALKDGAPHGFSLPAASSTSAPPSAALVSPRLGANTADAASSGAPAPAPVTTAAAATITAANATGATSARAGPDRSLRDDRPINGSSAAPQTPIPYPTQTPHSTNSLAQSHPTSYPPVDSRRTSLPTPFPHDHSYHQHHHHYHHHQALHPHHRLPPPLPPLRTGPVPASPAAAPPQSHHPQPHSLQPPPPPPPPPPLSYVHSYQQSSAAGTGAGAGALSAFQHASAPPSTSASLAGPLSASSSTSAQSSSLSSIGPAPPALTAPSTSLPPTSSSSSASQPEPSLHPPTFSPRHERTPTTTTATSASMNPPPFAYSHYHQPHFLFPPQPPPSSQQAPPPQPPPPLPSASVPQTLFQNLSSTYPPPAQVPAIPASAHSSHSHAPHPSFPDRNATRAVDGHAQYKTFRAGPVDNHGTSVKRHLEYFDVEASLKEVADSGGRLVEFSREYGHRARDLQRTGPLPGVLPTIAECDDMIRHQQRIQDLLSRLREMIVSEQHSVAATRHVQERTYKGAEFEMEEPAQSVDDGKPNGILAADARKRRGRAAPPGRCHSCNRAETPEWRRGPDGARTLCNACGLHYAKLTRKQGPKAALGGSSLRPKPMGPGQASSS